MKNVWEQKQSQDGVRPYANGWESLGLFASGVIGGTIVIVLGQIALSVLFGMHAVGVLQLAPWLLASLVSTAMLAEGVERKCPVKVYVLVFIVTTAIHFTGVIR